MHVISVKIPEELKKEIKELMKEEGLEEGIALRKLLTMAISEWKKERALKMLKKVVWVKEEGILRDLNARF
jgi:metal-responsive CopG/Arc/MetJ family transcriptional regulator